MTRAGICIDNRFISQHYKKTIHSFYLNTSMLQIITTSVTLNKASPTSRNPHDVFLQRKGFLIFSTICYIKYRLSIDRSLYYSKTSELDTLLNSSCRSYLLVSYASHHVVFHSNISLEVVRYLLLFNESSARIINITNYNVITVDASHYDWSNVGHH